METQITGVCCIQLKEADHQRLSLYIYYIVSRLVVST